MTSYFMDDGAFDVPHSCRPSTPQGKPAAPAPAAANTLQARPQNIPTSAPTQRADARSPASCSGGSADGGDAFDFLESEWPDEIVVRALSDATKSFATSVEGSWSSFMGGVSQFMAHGLKDIDAVLDGRGSLRSKPTVVGSKDITFARNLASGSDSLVHVANGLDSKTASTELSEEQMAHARTVLKACPELANARFTLVPSQCTDDRFWAAYFFLRDARDSAAQLQQLMDSFSPQAHERHTGRSPDIDPHECDENSLSYF
jgi:hypothetical protein